MIDKIKQTLTETTTVICIMLVALAAVFSTAYYFVNDRNLMAKNIDSAIVKDLDPLSVRCSYARSDDTICAVYAARPVINGTTKK